LGSRLDARRYGLTLSCIVDRSVELYWVLCNFVAAREALVLSVLATDFIMTAQHLLNVLQLVFIEIKSLFAQAVLLLLHLRQVEAPV